MAESIRGKFGTSKINLLVEYAQDHAMDETDLLALEWLLWKIWAHSDLIAFPRVATSLREIGGVAQKMWNEQLDAFGIERWSSLSDWLERHLPSIVSEIGIDQGTKRVAAGKNPVKGRGVGLKAVYAMLCETHRIEKYRERYRLLQGHVLFAFSLALGAQSSLETYREMCRTSRDHGQEESKQDMAKGEPLRKSCAQVGRALRRFILDKPAWLAMLGALEVNRSPASFAAWIDKFEFAPGTVDSSRALQDFGAIRSFLVTIYTDHGKDANWSAGGSHTSTGRDSVHGHVEFGLWGSVFQLPEDELAGHDGKQFYFFLNAGSEEEGQELGDSADDADESHETVVTRSEKPGALRPGSWKQTNRKMMANQLLPYDYDELNGSEIGQLWKGLWDWWDRDEVEKHRRLSKKQLETLEVGALLWVMLWTVSPIERAMKLTISPDPDEQSESPLSLLTCLDENGKEVSSTWRIKALPPRASTEVPTNSRPVIDHILLPDIAGGGAWPLKFFRIKKRNNGSAVFGRSLEDYEELIHTLFEEFKLRRDITDRVTAPRYSKVLFWRLLRRSDHDFSAVSLITGQDHVLNRSRLHYTTREVAKMQRLYVQCAEELAREIASVSRGRYQQIDSPIQDTETYLGVRHCPTLATVTTAVSTLRERVRQVPRLQLPRSQEEQRAFVREHDDLTLYTYWMFAFATGVRGIVAPYPRIERVDRDTGIFTIEDKKANSRKEGSKSRLLWLPPVVREQMQAYQVYLDELKRKSKMDSDAPCFFLDQDMRPVAIRPKELKQRVEALLEFPANIQRLFLRSELLERGCSVEVVDAFMGHWCFGEEPFAPFSTFNYAVYFASLERYVGPLLKEIGFDVVRRRVVH
jgi:integrase